MKFYTGIGARAAPRPILKSMTTIASALDSMDYVVRSGGANGADTAFEDGATGYKEIYLPWLSFNGNSSPLNRVGQNAMELAAEIWAIRYDRGDVHVKWKFMRITTKLFMSRNCYQVLGQDLNTPSEFIVCWTENAAGLGGTGQAIELARQRNIPVFDLADDDALIKLKQHAGF